MSSLGRSSEETTTTDVDVNLIQQVGGLSTRQIAREVTLAYEGFGSPPIQSPLLKRTKYQTTKTYNNCSRLQPSIPFKPNRP